MRWTERVPPAVIVIVILAVLIGGIAWMWFSSFGEEPSLEVHYPYWCDSCNAVYDVSELKKDYPANWRMIPGLSDSIVLCIRCNTGHAYPAVPCRKCKTLYVLHLIPDGRCPKCFPEVAEKARAVGVNLTPPELTK